VLILVAERLISGRAVGIDVLNLNNLGLAGSDGAADVYMRERGLMQVEGGSVNVTVNQDKAQDRRGEGLQESTRITREARRNARIEADTRLIKMNPACAARPTFACQAVAWS
jgi:hypothetical protein